MTTERVERLLSVMNHEEKVAQLLGLWVMVDKQGQVAPYQGTFMPEVDPRPLPEQLANGMGQLTRPFGSRPVEAAAGRESVDAVQRIVVEDTRLGIPVMVHEECLTGFMALGATAFPSPLNWGSTWNPGIVEQMGDAIRQQMRSVGVHQGLAPVLDVVRDARWGRVEECIAEDPVLVGLVACAYIRGLQGDDLRTGIAACAKHFAGHSFSEGGRNLAPAHVGPREFEDVFLLPFEMAVKLAKVRSVMNAYQDNDGLPAAASAELLTSLLRDRWGFEGIVVSDYFSVAFLHALHGVAADKADAAAQALHAGIDIELPNPDCYPLLKPSAELDLAVSRVLALKEELGLFESSAAPDGPIDLDPPAARSLARTIAEQSIVLLSNDGVLPLADPPPASLALIGPNAASGPSLLGNYTFPVHLGGRYREALDVPLVVTVEDGLRAALPDTTIVVEQGCAVIGDDRSGFDAAVAAARVADVAVVVVGDQSGNFGQGTSGEGTDANDLSLPGVQADLVRAVVESGTPTVVVLVSGRPYEVAWIAEHAAAVVAAWLPGEEGGGAVASVLAGGVNPSGKTPVSFGRGAGEQPRVYNAKNLGTRPYARTAEGPVFPFGHGLSYTTFDYSDLVLTESVAVDGVVEVSCVVRNSGARAGDEVVQVYVRDQVASVTRPVLELKAFQRVSLGAGESARVAFEVPVDMLSFIGRDMTRVVEPGLHDVFVGASSADIRLRGVVSVEGDVRRPGEDRALVFTAAVS